MQLDRHASARLLSAIGFAVFAVGLAMSAFQTPATDYNEMFWPQVVRGGIVALCILPPTRFALGLLPLARVSDASGLYNLSRNLGGAIGIALIDTIMFSRGPEHADRLMDLIKTNPAEAAAAMAITLDELPDPQDPMGLLAVMDAIEQASLTFAINEAWMLLAAVTACGAVLTWIMGPIRGSPPPVPARPDRR